MKKRLISALLALIMLVGCFAMSGCTQEESEIDTTGKRISMTLTMWLPAAKDTDVDDESVAQVERAINEITQSQFSTAVKLRVIPADEYDSRVLAKIKASKQEEIRQNSNSSVSPDEVLNTGIFADLPENDETANNDFEAMNASVFASYPSVESTQFDIFVIHGNEELTQLADEALICELDDNLSDESKVLTSYIYPTFLSGVKYMGSTYAIPNNRAMGKYEVMLVNKEIASALYYDPARFTSVEALFNYDNSGVSFIADASAYIEAQGLDVDPVAGTYNPPYLKFWNSTDDGRFSIISSFVGNGIAVTDVSFMNTFKNTNYVNATRNLKRISEESTPVDFKKSKEFAVGFTEATAEDIANYSEKYQVTVIQNPQSTKEEICASMFAVSSYTKDVDRSMEIITCLNTNTELRTILQYGVEGTHWRTNVDNNNVIDIISDKYQMDIEETGNVYMTYPAAGVPMSYWDYAKQQNLDSYMPITAGFTCVNEDTAPLFEELEAKSAEINKRVAAMSSAEFTASLESLRNEVDSLTYVQELTYVFQEGDDTEEHNLDVSLNELWLLYINQ